VSDRPSPTVQRRRLRTELRRARKDSALTQEQVAGAMDWSLSKIIRIETGAVNISTNDLMALLRLYEITDPARTAELVQLARGARQPSWWSKYRDFVSPSYLQYIEYEEAAYIIRSFEPLIIPGLLQTEEYATATVHKLGDDLSPKAIDARVEIRMIRQQLLEQPDPPLGFFIIDEAAIQHLQGETAVAQRQITQLVIQAEKPHVTIEIIPFSAGIYRGMGDPFIVVEFTEMEDNDVLYLETERDATLSHDEPGEISIYREVFEELRGISLGPERSLSYLRQLQADPA
jgi:transcriptional regulator with XRE-family HTH domain